MGKRSSSWKWIRLVLIILFAPIYLVYKLAYYATELFEGNETQGYFGLLLFTLDITLGYLIFLIIGHPVGVFLSILGSMIIGTLVYEIRKASNSEEEMG